MFIHVRIPGSLLLWEWLNLHQLRKISGSVHGIYAWVCIFACATCVHRPALSYELFKFVHCIGFRAEMKFSAGH